VSEHQWTGPGDDTGAAWSVLEEFASVVSHEIRTPLSIVKTAAETAHTHQDSMSREQIRGYLEMITRNSDLALLLIERISLARDIDHGDVDLSRQDVDLSQLVRESVSDLEAVLLFEHPTEVLAPETVTLSADPTAAREIVFNLLSNAAKYSAAGASIEVLVGVTDSTAHVIVRNHGGGVTPGDTERIFEKFERLDAGAPGTGLGLFISRGLARAHGGDLRVQPAAEAGSEFILTLPVAATN